MSAEKKGHSVFPFYLKPGPDAVALKWLGDCLTKIRGNKPQSLVAQKTGFSTDQIAAFESGQFHINLGQLRECIQSGYGTELEPLLAKCYRANREHFDPEKNRPFERDYHYTVSTGRIDGKLSPYLLLGGDPSKCIWAIPMRRLMKQPMITELLEIAPFRKRPRTRPIPANSHNGAEVIYVIHGTIQVDVRAGHGEGVNKRILKAGDYIHFLSRHAHSIDNFEKNTSALLLVIRLTSLPKEKSKR